MIVVHYITVNLNPMFISKSRYLFYVDKITLYHDADLWRMRINDILVVRMRIDQNMLNNLYCYGIIICIAHIIILIGIGWAPAREALALLVQFN